MLSVRNLVKVYQVKGGEEVRALDGVTIDFPDQGMVFLLGKSGSGKSTLLNVASGLDQPTDGELIVDGRSSKQFSVSDFDGYRNSYVGFVFQEFNMLNEFTIGQNVALALQLQNKPNDKEAVENILKAVDLEGVSERKPTTLSGGQKQRVAIARALIKNPKIIMADEPTGALDSQTGKQIFETLKNLSENRLVVVVTHDREFAERYADRIIELKDGKIISDEKCFKKNINQNEHYTFISDDTVSVKDWDKLNIEDVKEIAKVMKNVKSQTYITSAKNLSQTARTKIEEKTSKVESLEQTTVLNVDQKEKGTFIKSTLPFKNALKMAFDSLKTKPIRLAFTIILSIIAFTFFGVSATFMFYDPNYSVATALEGSDYQSIVLEKKYEAYFTSKELGDDNKIVENKYNVDVRSAFSEEDIRQLNDNKQNLKFAGIMDFGTYQNNLESVEGYDCDDAFALRGITVDENYKRYYSITSLCGFTDCGAAFMEENGFNLLAGNYPTEPTEIAVSKYIYEIYSHASEESKETGGFNFTSISSFIGAKINVGGINLTVSGIYSVGEIPEKFNQLLSLNTELDSYGVSKLKSDFSDCVKYSFHTLGFVTSEFCEQYRYSKLTIDNRHIEGARMHEDRVSGYVSQKHRATVFTPRSIWKNNYLFNYYTTEGEYKEFSLADDQVYLSSNYIKNYAQTMCEKINKNNLNEYEKFVDAFYRYNVNKYTPEDFSYILSVLISDYNKVTGETFTIPTTIHLKNFSGAETRLNVIGFYSLTEGKSATSDLYLVSDAICDAFGNDQTSSNAKEFYFSNHEVNPNAEKYGKVITLTNNSKSQTMYMLNKKSGGAWYAMKNQIYRSTSQTAEAIDEMKVIFYVAGGVFGLFAILMLFNFISVTITSKKKEIGILRAIGARRIDVFKIFIIEALIITLSCFIVSAVLSAIACVVINGYLVVSAVGVTALNFGVMSVLFLLVSTIAVAMIATLFPVLKAANKPPVDSIRSI